MPEPIAKIANSPSTKTTGIKRGEIQMMKSMMPVTTRRHMRKVSTCVPHPCHIRATSFGIKWISMVMYGVRFCRVDEPSH